MRADFVSTLSYENCETVSIVNFMIMCVSNALLNLKFKFTRSFYTDV